MKGLFLLAVALPSVALAAPAELPSTVGIEVAGQTQAQLLNTAQRCAKANLKNEQFTVGATGAMGLLTGSSSAQAAPPLTTPDPTAIIDVDQDNGRLEARHTFATAGFASEGIVRADLRVETKDSKFRMTWHDAVYTSPIANRWKEDLRPLIPAALPYKKAIAGLQAMTDAMTKCMTAPPPAADNW